MTLWLLKRGVVIVHRYCVHRGWESKALTPNQVADWLQSFSWVDNNDKVTIEIWQRYRGQMDVACTRQSRRYVRPP